MLNNAHELNTEFSYVKENIHSNRNTATCNRVCLRVVELGCCFCLNIYTSLHLPQFMQQAPITLIIWWQRKAATDLQRPPFPSQAFCFGFISSRRLS